MQTEEQRRVGLMFRKELPDGEGMLFDFARPQPVAMWMRNTIVPLDMIFIRADGTIANIAKNTTPLPVMPMADSSCTKIFATTCWW